MIEIPQQIDLEARRKQQAKQAIKQSEAQAEREQDAERARLENLPPEEQWKEKGKTLHLGLKSMLSSPELAVLETEYRAGRILAAALATEVAQAQAQLRMEEFITQLREHLPQKG